MLDFLLVVILTMMAVAAAVWLVLICLVIATVWQFAKARWLA